MIYTEQELFDRFINRFGEDVARNLAQCISAVNEKRQSICIEAVDLCTFNTEQNKQMKCAYIRGGNSYDKDLTPHCMTKSRLNTYFAKSAYSQYFDKGRKEMIERFAKESGYTMLGCDCSGFIVGLLRKNKVVSSGYDATADNLYKASKKTIALTSGNLVHKSGHCGIIVSSRYAVECVGGAYGLQMTDIEERKVFNFVSGKTEKMSSLFDGVGVIKGL